MGRGEATAGRLAAGLSEGVLQFLRVGHGKAGTVGQENAVPVPEFVGTEVVVAAAAARDGPLQAAEEADGFTSLEIPLSAAPALASAVQTRDPVIAAAHPEN